MRKLFILPITILYIMKKVELSKNEKLILYGLVKYPNLPDKHLSEILGLKHSTITSIRHRLKDGDFIRKLIIPKLQGMGCEMLVVIYTHFSPLIPLQERIDITGETIEVFDEIFLSVGEQDKGFSLSLSEDYATIGRINDIRTQTFGSRGLLEEENPNIVVFPFEISKIYRFFDFAPLLKNNFNLDFGDDSRIEIIDFGKTEEITFSDTEKNAYCMLISYPELSDSAIGQELGVSRHTISHIRRKFVENNLMAKVILPNFVKLGFEILTFYHIRFDPRNSPNMVNDEAASLMSDSSIFFASRRFEAVIISIYKDFDEYKTDIMRIMQVLKQNQWIAEDPITRTYSLSSMIFIKDFKFAPFASKIVGCDFWVKKLLNI